RASTPAARCRPLCPVASEFPEQTRTRPTIRLRCSKNSLRLRSRLTGRANRFRQLRGTLPRHVKIRVVARHSVKQRQELHRSDQSLAFPARLNIDQGLVNANLFIPHGTAEP